MNQSNNENEKSSYDDDPEVKEEKAKLEGNGELSILWGKIILKPNINKIHFSASMIHYLAMPFLFVSVEVLQPILFKNKYNVLPQDSGSKNANVLLVDILTKIIFAPIFGVLNDRYGRKPVLIYGICMAALGLYIMPLSNAIYPAYLLCRILYAHGAIAIATIPLLADYFTNETKGKASGLAVIGASLGAIFSSSSINFLINFDFDITQIYWIIAGAYFVVSILYGFHLKSGVYFREGRSEVQGERKSCSEMVKIGIKVSRCPWIIMGYVTNFISRGDSILLTLFLVLWSYNKNNSQDYHQSEIQAQTLSGVCYTVVLVFSIGYGILFERISKFKILASMFSFTALGCFMFNFADDPKSLYSYITMVIIGIGLSGLYTAALYLINTYSQTNYRGYITGISNIFSVLGIVVCVLGGYALEDVNYAFPFTFFGILSVIAIFILAVLYIVHLKKLKIWREEMKKQINVPFQNLRKIEEEDEIYKEKYDYVYEK